MELLKGIFGLIIKKAIKMRKNGPKLTLEKGIDLILQKARRIKIKEQRKYGYKSNE